MVWFLDERIREGGIPASASVINLQGAVEGFLPFVQAKRRDGTTVQTGDTTCVSVRQAGGLMVTCKGALTTGGTNTITLDASTIYQSSNGAALPNWDTSAQVDIFLTTAVPLLAQFDDAGNLLDPNLFRAAIIRPVATFASELGTVDGEGVAAPGVDARFDFLGGLFDYDIASSTPEDGVDFIENINTSTGRNRRVGIKPFPTSRDNVLLSGNALTLRNMVPAAGKPALMWIVMAWTDDGLHRSRAFVLEHASDPFVDVDYERGSLPFQLSGSQLQVRNDTGLSATVHYAIGVMG